VEGNRTHVRLQQRIDGIEVYGGELGVHFDGTDVYAIHGTLAISIDIGLIPGISESKALQTALRVSGATRTFKPTRLVVLSPNVDPSLKKTYLAWLFEVVSDVAGSAYQVLIDASDGSIIRSISLDQSSTKNVAIIKTAILR
jgi:Zn-dependent metalloprotease